MKMNRVIALMIGLLLTFSMTACGEQMSAMNTDMEEKTEEKSAMDEKMEESSDMNMMEGKTEEQLLAVENDILFANNALWEKVFMSMDKNVNDDMLSSNYGDVLMSAVEGAKDQFSAEEYEALKADAEKIREIEEQIAALAADSPADQMNDEEQDGAFPQFQGKDLDGNDVDNSLFANNAFTVVNFWFNGCKPCVQELDDLNALNERIKAQGGEVVGINVETLSGNEQGIELAKQILGMTGAKYRNIYFDANSEAGTFALGIMAFPTTYVFDRNGRIVGEPLLGGIDIEQNMETQELFEECLESWNGQIDWKYDFIFRCIEEKHSIHHIAKVLYHRNVEHVQVCDEQERKAIDMHLKRMNIKGNVEKTEYRGVYRVRYTMEETPLISIVIPNKDHVEDLKKCIDSLEKKSSYDNREYIIVENNSTEEQTFAYYKELELKCPRAKVVYWKEKGFNYPKINNYGVRYAKGEYILFLNNDTEIQNPDCLEEMLIHCSRPEVGAVGARLFYEDGTIQHVGVIVGLGGIAGHPYATEAEETLGHMGRVHMIQDLSAVTAACMMVKKTVFFEVGKFEPEYAVAFNDVDLCMKIRKAGYLIVYTPYARLTHYESKSRGLEDSREKVKRFDSEVALFEERWGKELEKGDPNYNPNFRLDEKDFRLNVHVRR